MGRCASGQQLDGGEWPRMVVTAGRPDKGTPRCPWWRPWWSWGRPSWWWWWSMTIGHGNCGSPGCCTVMILTYFLIILMSRSVSLIPGCKCIKSVTYCQVYWVLGCIRTYLSFLMHGQDFGVIFCSTQKCVNCNKMYFASKQRKSL